MTENDRHLNRYQQDFVDLYNTCKTSNVRTHNLILRPFRITIFAMEKHTYSECMFVALVIQHAKCTHRVASPGIPYFSTLSHKRHDFRIRTEHKIAFFLHKFCLRHFQF
jgi:hypothetical protein